MLQFIYSWMCCVDILWVSCGKSHLYAVTGISREMILIIIVIYLILYCGVLVMINFYGIFM